MKNLSLKNMSSSVHVKEVVLITASKPTPTHNLRLSALDSQPFLRFTIEYLLVYKPSPGLDRVTTTARIKAALGRALVPYYPLAGRVRVRTDGTGLEVVCRNQGALFIQAVSDYSSTDFESGPPKYCKQWWKLLSLHVVDVLNGAPPLVIQLTWLSDGGATLAVGFSHCLCDGIGSADFLNYFASLASGKLREAAESLKVKPVCWARHLVDPRTIRSISNVVVNHHHHHPEFKKVTDTCGFLSRFTEERLVPTSISFDKKRLNELKKSAGAMPDGLPSKSYTSFEVLAAHVWRSWAKALNLPSKQVLKLVFSVNIRNRVKPSLPSGYYGNAFVLGCAQTSAKELVEKGLGDAAELIKRAKERVDDGYVREVAESVSWERGKACPDSVGVLIMSQWSRLGLDKVDLGMGRPVEVGPVVTDRYCLLLPVCEESEEGGVKVNLAVPTSAVDQYLCLLSNPNSSDLLLSSCSNYHYPDMQHY